MSRLIDGETILQKFRYDEIRPEFEGTPVPFFLDGSPDSSNSDVNLPFVEMCWTPGTGRSLGTDRSTYQYTGSLTFLVFMPKGLNPFKAREVVAQIESVVTHAYRDYTEGTVTLGEAEIGTSRPVANAMMTSIEVETNLLLR